MPGQTHDNLTFSGLASELVKTTEFKKGLNSLVTEIMGNWGGQSGISAELARHAERILKRRLDRINNRAKKKGLDELLHDPKIMTYLRDRLPMVINGLVKASEVMIGVLTQASPAEQEAFFNQLFDQIQSGHRNSQPADTSTGNSRLFSMAQTIESVHEQHPGLFAERTIQLLEQVMVNIDFADLRIIFDNLEDEIATFSTGINDLLFEYPAKLILMLSLLPGTGNHILVFLTDLLKRFNDLPADILTDLLLSLLREVDAETTGKLLNNSCELIRQVHTGSALIGDAGSPQFSNMLLQKVETILKQIDTELLFKAKKALSEGREALVMSVYDAASEDARFPGAAFKHAMIRLNSHIRQAKRKVELLDDLGDAEAARVLAAWLSEWDAHESAEWINVVCAEANRLARHEPDVLKNVVTEFVNTLDLYDIEESITWIFKDLKEPLTPVIQTVAPVLVKEVIECLNADTGENQKEIEQMRGMLRQFILNGEES
jgi:hypothetical protein